MTDTAYPVPSPLLHRLIAAGHLRYWLIASWALPLWAVTSAPLAMGWFAIATLSGVARTIIETRVHMTDSRLHARLKLIIATGSCVAWAAAPLMAALVGHAYGLTVAATLLATGYMLVFTQMRAEPREALIVSMPYTAVAAYLIAGLWGTPAFWVSLAIVPVLGLSLLIKVVVTEIKDAQLEAVNLAQAGLILDLEAARDRADAANDAKSNFLGVVSHELRTPMTSIRSFSEILRDGGDMTPEQRSRFSGVIHDEAQASWHNYNNNYKPVHHAEVDHNGY